MAAAHAPPYHAHDTLAVFSRSPICCCVCGGSVEFTLGSDRFWSPPAGGAFVLGWYAGCIVLTAKKSGVSARSFANFGAPPNADAGEPVPGVSVMPSASTCEMLLAGGPRFAVRKSRGGPPKGQTWGTR